jgi:DNA-binding beta-propeller fold protein YncE
MTVSNPYVVRAGRPGRLYVQASPWYGACCSRVLDTEARTEIEVEQQFACSYDDFEVSSDGAFLYSQVCAGGSPSWLVKYDVSTDQVSGVKEIDIGGGYRLVALRPTDDLVCLSDGKVYRTEDLSLAATLEEWTAAAFSPDGRTAFLSNGTRLARYSMATYALTGTYTLSGGVQRKGLAVDPDGERIYALVGGTTGQKLEVVRF